MIDGHHSESTARDPVGRDPVGKLLGLAGPLPEPAAERRVRVRSAVREEWLQQGAREAAAGPGVNRRGIALALAASLAAAVGIAAWLVRPAPGPLQVGTLEMVTGPITLTAPDGRVTRLTAGASGPGPLQAGTRITTGEGRVAFRLSNGASVRVDAASRLAVASPGELDLEGGAIYVASGGVSGSVEVRTTFGVVTDVGTSFEVRLLADRLRVRVREGLVRLHGDGDTVDAGRGEELSATADGRVHRRRIATHGPAWRWPLSVAPAYTLDGDTLAGYLDWLVAETGWEARFSDPEIAAETSSLVLHGSVAGIPPDETVEPVLASCGLVAELDGGVLVISREPES